ATRARGDAVSGGRGGSVPYCARISPQAGHLAGSAWSAGKGAWPHFGQSFLPGLSIVLMPCYFFLAAALSSGTTSHLPRVSMERTQSAPASHLVTCCFFPVYEK